MQRTRLLRPAGFLVLLLIVAVPGSARAQAPDCPADSSAQANGEINGIASVEFPIDLAPCQTLSVSVTTWDNHPWWGASFKFQLCNNPNGTCSQPTYTELDDDNWSILNSPVTRSIPSGAPWIPPYRGTRGAEGLPVRGILSTTSNVAGKVFYQITVSKVRRPDYNIGGSAISNAPLVSFGTTYRGSIHPWEPGQYFKVHLEPGQGFGVAGTVLGHSSYGPYWEINVLDASATLVTRLTYGTAYGGPFPFSSGVYTNSSQSAVDLYVQFLTKYYPIHDFQLAFDMPQLSLFLDADQNFDVANPQDDSPQYLPCSLLDGSSLPLSGCPQALTVIAAYKIGSFIAKATSGSAVTFSLANTSGFAGIAMNYGNATDTTPDFALRQTIDGVEQDVESLVVNFGTDNTARARLLCRDYGGFTTVHAGTAELEVPVDTNNHNSIADRGWRAWDLAWVADSFGSKFEDVDSDPPGDGTAGDELGAVEEYRGFVVRGVHRRTNPGWKDLFIFSEYPQISSIGDAVYLPFDLHLLAPGEIDTADRVINPRYTNGGEGGDLRAAGGEQRALHIIDAGYSSCCAGETPVIPVGATAAVPYNVTGPIRIYSQTIRQVSPPHNNTSDVDAFDEPKTNQTIGHEVGHGVHVIHWNKDPNNVPLCPEAPLFADRNLTVMVGCNWFHQTSDVNDTRWNNIPHAYDQIDLGMLRLKK
jgi:hypothetical protein